MRMLTVVPLFAVVLFIACGQSSGPGDELLTPEAAADAYMERAVARDYQGAWDLLSDKDRKLAGNFAQFSQCFAVPDASILDVDPIEIYMIDKEDNDDAVVKYTDDVGVHVHLTDGQWHPSINRAPMSGHCIVQVHVPYLTPVLSPLPTTFQ